MEFLKALFGGKALTYEEMVQAINAHNGDEANKDKQIKVGNLGGGEYVSKAKHDALQELLNGKNTELDTANGLIADLKKSTKGNEELQGKVAAYEQQVAQLQEQLKQTQLDAEIKVALLAAKATDVPYLTFKMKENGTALEMGEDGKIKGIDDLITGLKTQFPSQFESVTNKNIIDVNKFPNTNQQGGGISQEQFNKMGYQGRLKLKQEQPEVYAQMTGKATE